MHFKSWLGRFFFTPPALITNRRHLKWKNVAASAAGIFLIIILWKSFTGTAKASPDNEKYRTLSPDIVAKQGVVVLKAGDYEIKRKSLVTSASRRSQVNDGGDQGQVISRKDRAKSEYFLPAGTRIAFILDGSLNSQLSHSAVTALMPNGYSFKGRTLLPAGTKALGYAEPSEGGDRIGIQFDQIVLPSGHQITAKGTAQMPDGSPGIVGEYHSGKWGHVAGALGSSFLSGAAAAFETNQANAFGIQQPEGSTKNAILNGVARAALDQGKRFSDDAQNSKGYVTAPSGMSFQIYFDQEVDLSGALQ
jgi:hypothetical protein